MIKAGALRHKITIQSATNTSSAYGTVPSWGDVIANRPAAILPDTVGRDILGPAQGSKESIRFMMRYSTIVITPDMRIVHGGQNYRITHVENVRGMNVELIITAETART